MTGRCIRACVRALHTRLRRVFGNEYVLLLIFSVLIGPAVSHGIVGFRKLIGLFQLAAFATETEKYFATVVAVSSWWHLLLAPTLGGLIVGLYIYYFMPSQRNHGIPDIMEACAYRGGRMDVKAGIGAALASAAAIGSGASVGREGPAVHIGASISGWIAEQLNLSRTFSLTLLGCGVASAVSASFNVPIAGVFFALEVVIGQYTLSVFAPIVIASVVSAVVIRNYFGDYPAFVVPEYFIDSLFELPMFMVLGLVCALVASVFMYSVFAIQDRTAKLPMPAWLRPAIGGLVIGAIAFAYPQVLGVGYQATGLALKEALPLGLMFALIFAKMAATSVALGSGFAGGIFSPSLFIGAMTGGVFGMGVAQILPDFASTHGAYTVLGMVGVASAVLGAPISTMLIIFELTNNTQMTIAVMVTVTTATVVAQQIVGHRSFFTWALERRGVTLADTSEQELMLATTIEEVISDDFEILPKSASVKDTRDLLASKRPGVVFIVDKDGHLEGGLTSAGFLERTHNTGSKRMTAGTIARPCETLILPNASLDRALKLMAQDGADYLPVVDDIQARKVIGVITLKDLMLARSRASDAGDA
jgi:CIC family chloride channel protein